MSRIKLGYKFGTEEEEFITPSHMIVTGVTQHTGKTTTLESLIGRSGKKSIVFRTKIGEKSFLDGTIIPPYFEDRSDWQFIKSLIEAIMKERIGRMEQAQIIKLCKISGNGSLSKFKDTVDERLARKKISSFEEMILTNLQAYLEIVIPTMNSIRFSTSLELVDGLNIVDLEEYSAETEVQSLIIRSVLSEVLHKHKGVIVVIPEAWKFIPQERGNPCKLVVEEFIRQGATNQNFLWIDSQDISSVDKAPLKQISEWILGYQSEKNEVKHTLDQLPLPKASKPEPDEIMNLGKGMFYYATREGTVKVYVQPFWMDDASAKSISMGRLSVKDVKQPEIMPKIQRLDNKIEHDIVSTNKTCFTNEELTERSFKTDATLQALKREFFDKFEGLKKQSNVTNINEDEIVKKVLLKIPRSTGGNTIYVAPLEKLKKDFIIEAKEKILSDIQQISDDAKKMLKYIETRGIEIKINELLEKCFFMSVGKAQYAKIAGLGSELTAINVSKKGNHAGYMPMLKERIKSLIAVHEASEQEMDQLYNHIIFEILK